MVLRAWWAVLGPAALVAVIAVLRGDHGEDLEVVAGLLALSGLAHAVRPGARRGTPTQSLTQVLLVAFSVGAAAGLTFLAVLLVVFSAVCGTSCSGAGPSAGPALVGVAILLVALAVVVAPVRAWRAVERRRTAPGATPRPLLLAPAVTVAAVLVALSAAAAADDRPRPAVAARVVATAPCVPVISAAACVPSFRLAAAGSGGNVLAVWRQGGRIEGALSGRRGPARRVTVATGLPRAVRDEDGSATAVAPAPGGGFVVAWALGDGPRLGVRRVGADGTPGRAATLPATGRRPALAVASTRRGTVVVAAQRADAPGATTRVRALGLDARLRPRGGWRTVATDGAVEPLRVAATGEDRIDVSRGPWSPRAPVSGRAEAAESVVADLTDPADATRAVAGAAVVYHAAQPRPADWLAVFPHMTRTIATATAAAGAKLVFADNLYAYGPVDGPLREDTPARPAGPKSAMRRDMADALLAEHRAGRLRVAIGRASDYLGPGGVGSALGEQLFTAALAGKTVRWPGPLDVPHTVSFLPDVARGLAVLGETDHADGRVWHLPAAPAVTGHDFGELLTDALGRPVKLASTGPVGYWIASRFVAVLRELAETRHQWLRPWIVDDQRFRDELPAVVPTPLQEAVTTTAGWWSRAPQGERNGHSHGR